MPDFRRGAISRNRNKDKVTNIKPVVIVFVSLIFLCAGALIYRHYEKSVLTSKEQENANKEIYLLFEEIERTTENLVSGVSENNNYYEEDDVTIKIVTVGDILCEESIYEDAYNKETGTYNFSHMFSDIRRHTLNADITLGLLETNFVKDQPYSGNIKYNSPRELGEALRNIGIDILHTANNHSLDYGFDGIKSTIDTLEELEIDTVRYI